MKVSITIELEDGVKKQLMNALAPLKGDFPYLEWMPWQEYHITIARVAEDWSEEEIRVKLEDALFDLEKFSLVAKELVITIHHSISIYLVWYKEAPYKKLVDTVYTTFAPDEKPHTEARMLLARHKIPSKQQYLHLKKELSRFKIELTCPVNEVGIVREGVSGIHLESKPPTKVLLQDPL